VSGALSQPLYAGGTDRVEEFQKHALTGREHREWQRDNTLVTGLGRIVRGDNTVNRPYRGEVSLPVAHIEKRPDRRKPWRVRYRDPTGRERSRSFARKADADRFMATVQADLIRGDWTDPRLSKTRLAEWSERWLVTKTHLKPKTLAGYRSNLDVHVLPAFGDYQLRHIDRMAAEEWIANLQASGLGPSGVRQARQVLNAMLTLAVDAGYLPMNPVDGTSTPRLSEPEMLFLDADEVERLADTIRQPYGTLVYLLAYGGLRWGEAAALRRGRCDLPHSRIEVAESLADRRRSPPLRANEEPSQSHRAHPRIPPRPFRRTPRPSRLQRSRSARVHHTDRYAAAQQQLQTTDLVPGRRRGRTA
jgi:integrase